MEEVVEALAAEEGLLQVEGGQDGEVERGERPQEHRVVPGAPEPAPEVRRPQGRERAQLLGASWRCRPIHTAGIE